MGSTDESFYNTALMAVSEMNEMGHDVFFPRSDRGIKAYAYHGGSGTKLELERVNGVFELPVELAPYKRTTSKSSNTGASSSPSAPEQLGSLMKKLGRQSTQSDRGTQCSEVPRNPGHLDRVDRARLVEHCGSRDDSPSWNLSRVKQGETIRVDDMHPQG